MRDDKRFIKQRILKRVFLKRVKKRLENEVGIYLSLLSEKQLQDPNFPKVGFWMSIRYLMPAIDALSNILLHRGRTDRRSKSVRFMERELDIEYPFIVWEMYRHTLIHGDEMRSLSYRNKRVRWGVSIGLGFHIFTGGQTQIDITKLYIDLISFLDREISTAKGHVYIDQEVKYKRNIRSQLRREILDI